MRLSKLQKEALTHTPLSLISVDLMVWNMTKWVNKSDTRNFNKCTIDSLLKRGLLEYKKYINGSNNPNEVVLTDKATTLGYKYEAQYARESLYTTITVEGENLT